LNRIDRLFAILLLLQSRQTIRASEIAQRFEITERTVYRDIAALMQMGVPVVSLPGVGYQMMEGFYLPPLVFTPEEANALFLGASMLAASGNFVEAAHKALEKLSVVLPDRTRRNAQSLAEMIHFYFPKNTFHLDTPYLLQVREAIANKTVIRIQYHSRAENSLTEREVDSYGITTSQSAWYFYGYCHLRKDIRSFRLDRVESLVNVKRHFSIQPFSPTQASSERHLIRIRVNSAQARWVRERQHYGFIGEEVTDDEIVMTYQVETFSEIQAWILAWGASVEVIEPLALREAIFHQAEAILKRRTS
jgi:predicted DNA-binding transcriptional regulator YafY